MDGAQLTLENNYARSTPHFFEHLIRAQEIHDEDSPANSQRSSAASSVHWSHRSNNIGASRRSSTIQSRRNSNVVGFDMSSTRMSGGRMTSNKHPQSRKSSTGGEPFAAIRTSEQLHRDSMASARAIEHQLGIYSNGTPVPLTSWQRLWYANREHWLHNKVKQSRLKAKEVVDKLERLQVPDRTLKDIALIQSFVTEHVSLAYRSALKNKFEENEFLTPKKINPLLWILGWMVNIGAVGFCLYWVLTWGIVNTGTTLNNWRTSYIVSVSQDILLYEVTKMGFKYVFTLVSVRPQLSAIRQVINEAALSYIQYGPPKHQSKSEISVVQHFSPSCRAASMGEVKTLAAAAILRQITDADYERCQQHRTFALSTLVYFFMFVMALIAMIHEELEDTAMDPVVHSMWTGIFMVLAQIDISSPTTVIVLVLVGSFLSLYYTLAYPDVIKTARNIRRVGVYYHHVRRFSHHHYENQRKLREVHNLPWRQRLMHEFRRGYISLKVRVVYYWSLLQFMCTSEYWTYSQLQRSTDDALWMELNRFAVLISVNATGGDSTVDELLSLQQTEGTKKHPASIIENRDEVAPKKLTALFARKQNSFFGTSMVQRAVQKKMLGRIPDEIMVMRPTGGAPVDLGLEMKHVAHKAWLMGKVLEGVEGGIAELYGNAFIDKDGHDDQRTTTDKLVAPALYANKARAYAAPHMQCDITSDKDKALRLILVRLRRIEGEVIPGDSKDSTFCSDKDIKNYYVTFEELKDVIEWVWNVYSPGNLPLSPQERKEACEEFDKWQLLGRYWESNDVSALLEGIGGVDNVLSWSAEPQPLAIPSPTAAGGGGGGGGRTLDGRKRLAPLRVQTNQPQVQPRKQSLLATYDHFTPLPLSEDISPLMSPTETIHPLVPSAVLDKLKYYKVAINQSSTKAHNPSSNEDMLVLSASQRHIGLPGKDPNRPKYITAAVSFLEFRHWFLHMMTRIEHLRDVSSKAKVGTKKADEVQRKLSDSPLTRGTAAAGTISRLSGSITPATVLPLVHVQVSQTVVDTSSASAFVGSVWDSVFLVGFFTRWYRQRQTDNEDWTTRKTVVVVNDSAYFRSVFTAAAISVLPYGSTVTITSVKAKKSLSIEYIVASKASAVVLSSSLSSGEAAMTTVLQKSYPTATVTSPTVVPVPDPAMIPPTDQSKDASSNSSTLAGFFTRWNQNRQKTRVFISPDITAGDDIQRAMHNDVEHGKMILPERVDGNVSLKVIVEPGGQLSMKDPDSLLPSMSLIPFSSMKDGNSNPAAVVSPHTIPRLSPDDLSVSIPTFDQLDGTPSPIKASGLILSPNSVSSSPGMQRPISSPNALRALGFSIFSERSQVQFEGNYSEHTSIGEPNEVDTTSPVRMPAEKSTMDSMVPIEATHSSEKTVTKHNSEGSIDIDRIENLLSGYMEYNEVNVEGSPKMPTDPPAMSSVIPTDVNDSSTKMMEDIEKLIMSHLEIDDAESKTTKSQKPTKSKKPDFNRQSSDLKISCRLTASEKELLDDLFRPIETDSNRQPQVMDEEERARQEVEAAAKHQAAIDKKLQEERVREEERRLDLLTKQAHREAMQKAEERFMAAEAEKKRLQQEAVDNELKAKAAIEEKERKEQERLLEKTANVKATPNMKASDYTGKAQIHLNSLIRLYALYVTLL